MKFRKKPVEIDAIQWEGSHFYHNGNLPDWLPEPTVCPSLSGALSNLDGGEIRRHGTSLYIGTLEGTHEAKAGDWIIRGVEGELYPCKPNIFDATYEAVA